MGAQARQADVVIKCCAYLSCRPRLSPARPCSVLSRVPGRWSVYWRGAISREWHWCMLVLHHGPSGFDFFFPWSLKSWPEPDEGGRRPCQVRQPLNRSLTSNHLPRRSALNTDPWFMQLNPPRPFPASEVARRAAYMAPVTCALGSRIFVGSLEARRTLGGTKISVSLKREFTAFFSSFSLCPPLRGSAI